MRRSIFIDTSAWYALADSTDSNHRHAETTFRTLLTNPASLLTSNHVVSETFTLMRIRLGSRVAMKFLDDVRASSIIERVFVSMQWEEAAEDLLRRYEDQRFSYVDASSFITMQRLGIPQYFAYDSHFSVLGFIPVEPDASS